MASDRSNTRAGSILSSVEVSKEHAEKLYEIVNQASLRIGELMVDIAVISGDNNHLIQAAVALENAVNSSLLVGKDCVVAQHHLEEFLVGS